jgi:hypothetical protein
MTIDFTCQKCESGFEIEAQDLIDGAEKLACPHCNAKPPAKMTDDFVAALGEMQAQVAALASRFSVSLAVETEDLEELESDEDDDDADEDELDEEGDDDVDEDDDDLDYDEDEDDFEDEDEDDR